MAVLGSSSSRTAGAPAQPKPAPRVSVRQVAAERVVSRTPTPYTPGPRNRSGPFGPKPEPSKPLKVPRHFPPGKRPGFVDVSQSARPAVNYHTTGETGGVEAPQARRYVRTSA